MSSVPQWPGQGKVMFYMFINYLHQGIESTLKQFADDTTLRGSVNLLKGKKNPYRGIQIGWINGLKPAVIAFSKTKFWVLTLVAATPCNAIGLGHGIWKAACCKKSISQLLEKHELPQFPG